MSQSEVTRLLQGWHNGDGQALEQLMPLVYDELRRIARNYVGREREGHTLQATGLVNEAFMRLVGQDRVDWKNRAHFFAIAATMMRRILVDHSRRRLREKRGDGAIRVTWTEGFGGSSDSGIDALHLDQALKELEALDPRQARIVDLRFFAGLTVEECAQVLSISERTVKREWRMARAWLHGRLKDGESST